MPAQDITEGPFAGWKTWVHADPFEQRIGPVYYRQAEDGGIETALDLEPHHMNGLGSSHGGLLMTVADQALFAICTPALGSDSGVTVSLSGDFLGPSHAGERLSGRGEITRAGGSLLFARGSLQVGERPVLAFHGIIKRLRRKDHNPAG